MRTPSLAAGLLVALCMSGSHDAGASPSYAGSASCRPCHPTQSRAWTTSAHAVAMRPTAAVGRKGGVLLAKERIGFGADGASSADFHTDAKATTVTVSEPNSSPVRADVPWVLGAEALEQPLVALDRGRLQALPVAYDPARRQWFDIFQGEERLPGEFGHWLGRGMNANSQCIECHATAYRRNHDLPTRGYSSTWAETGVGCESCHGPGGDHVSDPKKPYGPFRSPGLIAAFRPKPAPAVAAPAPAQQVPAEPPPTAGAVPPGTTVRRERVWPVKAGRRA